MNRINQKRTSSNDLEIEARNWDLRVLTPEDWHDAPEAIPQAAASTMISLRMPIQMLTILKAFAQRQGVGYQVLLKRWLDERIRKERDILAKKQVVKLSGPRMFAVSVSMQPEQDQEVRVLATLLPDPAEKV